MAIENSIEGAGNFITAFTNGTWFQQPWVQAISLWATILFWLVVILGVGYVVWTYWLRYDRFVRIIKKTGSGIKITHDRARKITDEQGKVKLLLMKSRHGKDRLTTPEPKSEYIYILGKKEYYDFLLDDNGQLHPIQFNADSEGMALKVIPQERQTWMRMETRRSEEKYDLKSKWEKYLPMAMMAFTMLIIAIILYFFFNNIGAGLERVALAMERFANALA